LEVIVKVPKVAVFTTLFEIVKVVSEVVIATVTFFIASDSVFRAWEART
jgi:hypothetical protein